MSGPRRAPAVLAFAVAGVSLAVYLPRLCPTLAVMGDSAMFVSAAAVWGIAQPPGYPLYTGLAHLFTWLPWGELPWRVHLLSALFHAGTVALVALLILRLTGSRAAAVGGALFLAFCRAFFLGSLYAEVFPLNDLFTAAVLLIAWIFVERSRAFPSAADRELLGWLALLALVSGLASAHHQMIALAAPALALLVARGRWRLLGRPARTGLLAALFLLPLVVFTGLLWLAAARHPSLSWGEVHDLPSLWALVTRRDYGGLFSPHIVKGSSGALLQLEVYGRTLFHQLGPAGLVLAVGGLVGLRRYAPVAAWALGLTWLIAGPLFAVANALPVQDEGGIAFAERFVTMSLVPAGVLVGCGLALVLARLEGRLRGRARLGAHGLAASMFLLPLAANARAVDLSGDRRGAAFADDLVRDTPDGSLVLLTGDEWAGAAAWRCEVQRRCGDRIVFSPGQLHLAWKVAQLRRRHPRLLLPPPRGRLLSPHEVVAANLPQRPVAIVPALMEHDPVLAEAFAVLPQGLLVRLLPGAPPADLWRAAFLEECRGLLDGQGCEGCSMRRSALAYPSLETALPAAYALALINHGRVAQAVFGDAALGQALVEQGARIDPDLPGPPPGAP